MQQRLRQIAAGALVAVVLVACGPTGGESLSNMLKQGRCRVVLAIWDKVDQGAAEGYRDANNQPTPSCPKPDITIQVITDPKVQDGSVVGDRVALRYQNKATPPPSTSAPSKTPAAA